MSSEYEVVEFQKQLEKITKTLKETLRKMEDTQSEIQHNIAAYGAKPFAETSLIKLQKEAYKTIATQTIASHKWLTERSSFETAQTEQFRSEYEKKLQAAIPIKAGVLNGYLAIKMPRPYYRYGAKTEELLYLDILFDSVFKAKKECDIIIPAQRIFCFWHVYPKNGKQPYHYTDNDNFVTKPIIDRVCSALGIGDGGLSTHLFFGSERSDKIEPATYLHLIPQGTSCLDFLSFENAICNCCFLHKKSAQKTEMK